ncbi:MAG: hypothetical protein QOC90_1269 [Mycobacterium sp.]|nr:hypothetical protein [Mycobacterium sp.]
MGLMLFSVGDGADGGACDVVVVVVVEVSGAFCASLAQDADKPTIPTIASPPATAETRRTIRCDSISNSNLVNCYQLILGPGPV